MSGITKVLNIYLSERGFMGLYRKYSEYKKNQVRTAKHTLISYDEIIDKGLKNSISAYITDVYSDFRGGALVYRTTNKN